MNPNDLWKNAERIKLGKAKPPRFDVAHWRQWHSAGKFTRLMLILCLVIFIAQQFAPAVFDALMYYTEHSMQQFAMAPWRWFTPVLMHGDWIHLGFNLVIWWLIANQIEQIQGSTRLILLTAVIAALSNGAQFLLSGPYFLGLSGVNIGLVFYAMVYKHLKPSSHLVLSQPLILVILFSIVLGFVFSEGIANTAHLSGAVVGAALGLILSLFMGEKS